MIITSSEYSVKFDFGNDNYAVYPKGKLIAIADKSDEISFKLIGSRKTVFAEQFSNITPSGADASETVELLSEIL